MEAYRAIRRRRAGPPRDLGTCQLGTGMAQLQFRLVGFLATALPADQLPNKTPSDSERSVSVLDLRLVCARRRVGPVASASI